MAARIAEQDIKKNIKFVIDKILKVKINDDAFLMSQGIRPEYFLYVVIELEDQYNLPICEIIRTNNYGVLTLNNLSEKCVKIMNGEDV